MTRYFSQLAQHTGLKVGGDRRKPAARAVAREARDMPRLAPLHVVETTMVEPPRPAGPGDRDSLQHMSRPPGHDGAPRETSRADRREAVDAQAPAAVPREASARPAPAPVDVRVTMPAAPTPTTGATTDKSGDIGHPVSDSGRRGEAIRSEAAGDSAGVQKRSVPRDRQDDELSRPPRALVSEPVDASEGFDLARSASPQDDQSARHTSVQRYLQEVRAWVATSPEADFIESPETHDTDDAAQHRDALVVTPARESIVSRADRGQTIDVQEFSLSIGNISVVIEEPRPPVVTPPPVERTSAPEPVPMALSRYYLRRW